MTSRDSIETLKPEPLRGRIEALLAEETDDQLLRERLAELAVARAFGGLTWLWGPKLFRRNRVVFRPFILTHFSSLLVTSAWTWRPVAWKGDVGRTLDAWLAEVAAVEDHELFRRLAAWKYGAGLGGAVNSRAWRRDLLEVLRTAANSAEQHAVLDRFDLPGELDEKTAGIILELATQRAATFILNHLPFGRRRTLWASLFDRACGAGQQGFAYRLYRRQIPIEQWRAEVLELANSVHDAGQLCAALELRHPEGAHLPLAGPFLQLVELRGRDVFPYLHRHLDSAYRAWWGGRDAYQRLLELAQERGWWDLWSGLIRCSATEVEFNDVVLGLLADEREPPAVIANRLMQLTGVSREWNVGPYAVAHIQPLDDATAVALYAQYPALLRGPFKPHIAAGWTNTFPLLTDAARAAEDHPLIDFIASRLVTRYALPQGWGTEQTEAAERLSYYYEALQADAASFAQRAAAVLSQVPAYAFADYRRAVRTNRLTRLFYECAPEFYLDGAAPIRDLLESPEIWTQALAFRILGLPRGDARRLAADNVDLLAAALLRPLQRKTRQLALRAIENAADGADSARRIHARCRDALELPDSGYPKEALVGLIGRLLARWPTLRSPDEQPQVYTRSAG